MSPTARLTNAPSLLIRRGVALPRPYTLSIDRAPHRAAVSLRGAKRRGNLFSAPAGAELPKPPSVREVATRSVDGGREKRERGGSGHPPLRTVYRWSFRRGRCPHRPVCHGSAAASSLPCVKAAQRSHWVVRRSVAEVARNAGGIVKNGSFRAPARGTFALGGKSNPSETNSGTSLFYQGKESIPWSAKQSIHLGRGRAPPLHTVYFHHIQNKEPPFGGSFSCFLPIRRLLRFDVKCLTLTLRLDQQFHRFLRRIDHSHIHLFVISHRFTPLYG